MPDQRGASVVTGRLGGAVPLRIQVLVDGREVAISRRVQKVMAYILMHANDLTSLTTGSVRFDMGAGADEVVCRIERTERATLDDMLRNLIE